ncbi:cell envelope-related function transcriptional attenuator common domain-containing protein [Asanoa hainanensis]|uniref:Cell envelope-related function transcriptional attenuator common domain-containing protein n=1 Tax=Asanoa hainanensis TaxID=560556 RepID=A0A239PEE7_9ACTN|nr:LCP family protein [Asanoa hainanensis]SNT65004.1 cell envelope-related function transcriptional attenuator common domain-containing protein [Asanoa hainanensis]
MIEEQLRDSFERHEILAPPSAPLRAAIDRAVVRRRRNRFGRRLAGAALAVVAALSAPFVLRDTARQPIVDIPLLPGSVAAVDRPLTVAVLGVDDDGGRSYRADTVLLVHVPAGAHTAYLVSLPRDLLVEIPDKGRARLGETFYFGSQRRGQEPDLAAGAALTAGTITATTGLSVDATVTVRYSGLREVTDALGGVEICIDRPVTSRRSDHVYPAGCQRLDGRSMLDLLRQRKLPHGVYDRDANGRAFVRGLINSEVRDPVRLARVVHAAADGIAVAGVGITTPQLLRVATEIDTVSSIDIGSKFRGVVIDGVEYERLDPTLSKPVFDAIKENRLTGWVQANPQAVR